MKNNITKKTLTILLTLAMIITSMSILSFAEDTPTPSAEAVKVEKISFCLGGKIEELSGNFAWDEVTPSEEPGVENGVVYAVRVIQGEDADAAKIVDGISQKAAYTVALENNQKYTFKVLAVKYTVEAPTIDDNFWTDNEDKVTEITEEISENLKASTVSLVLPKTRVIGEVSQLESNKVKVSWTAVDNATKYELYRNGSKIKEFGKETLSYTDSMPSGKYSYVVRAYNKDGFYVDSAEQSASLSYLASVYSNCQWTAKAKKKIVVYKNKSGSKKLCTISKGKTLPLTGGKAPKKIKFWGTPTRVQVKINGTTGWVKWSQVSVNGGRSLNDMTVEAKEEKVKGLSSPTNYLIWVSRYTQRVNIFQKKNGQWKLIRVCDCATGNYYQPAVGGTYYLNKHKSKVTKVHKSGRLYYYNYVTTYKGSGTFHTRAKWSSSGKLRNEIKRKPTTKGCVRLYDASAIYVYKLPTRTAVLIK